MARLPYFLMLWPVCAAAQMVEGRVLDAATGAGAAGVKVELLRGATPFYETATDGGGRFLFDNVREADYAARYQSPRYFLTAGASDYRTFHVAEGNPVKLEARLLPWSRISGRVMDGRGNAVANAPLELTGPGMLVNGRTYLRTSWGEGGGGQLSESPSGMTFRGNTDANGKFEVRVMPGAYGLCVTPPLGLKPPNRAKDGPVLGWRETCYPGALPEAASKIVALPGGEAVDIELKLVAVPVHAVRGAVLNPDGTPAPRVGVMVGGALPTGIVESKADGTFEFSAVGEGEWRLSAEAKSDSVKLRAVEWIEVTRHDLENVKLRLAAPLTLRGRVVMDAPKDAPSMPLQPFILSQIGGHIQRDGDLRLPGAIAVPDVKGDFVVQDAYPGVYRLGIQLQPPPPPYYLNSIRAGDADLLTQEVEISSDLAITVLYKTDTGSILGKAENCASGGVLLVPGNPALRRHGLSRSGPCDSSGRYEVRGVRPGDYYALAFAGNGPVLVVDEALISQGVKVTVRAGEVSSADLRAVTAPVY